MGCTNSTSQTVEVSNIVPAPVSERPQPVVIKATYPENFSQNEWNEEVKERSNWESVVNQPQSLKSPLIEVKQSMAPESPKKKKKKVKEGGEKKKRKAAQTMENQGYQLPLDSAPYYDENVFVEQAI